MKFSLIFVCLFCQSLTQEIARQKCAEYAEAVFQPQIYPDFLLRKSASEAKISTCPVFRFPRIVGGKPVRNREFPHMAVVGYGQTEYTELEWLCGGALISEIHVLTAAHCAKSFSGAPQKVRLGTINLDEMGDYVQEKEISKIILHPDYKKPKKYNDIAILFLDSPVKFTAHVRPACLSTTEDINVTTAEATGFGRRHSGVETNVDYLSMALEDGFEVHSISTYFSKGFDRVHHGILLKKLENMGVTDDQETSTHLLKVDLDIIPNDECIKYLLYKHFELPQNLTDSLMCAGSLEGERDTCQGDSGGPLQISLDFPYCMHSIIGVTSFGRFCGMKFSPGLYTKVDQFVPWIEETIWS